MKKIIIFLLLITGVAYGQVYQKLPQYGYEMDRVKANSVLQIPSDTVTNKTGVARIGNVAYIGNGSYWTAANVSNSAINNYYNKIDYYKVALDTLGFILTNKNGREDTILFKNSLAAVINEVIDTANLSRRIDTAGKYITSTGGTIAITRLNDTTINFDVVGGGATTLQQAFDNAPTAPQINARNNFFTIDSIKSGVPVLKGYSEYGNGDYSYFGFRDGFPRLYSSSPSNGRSGDLIFESGDLLNYSAVNTTDSKFGQLLISPSGFSFTQYAGADSAGVLFNTQGVNGSFPNATFLSGANKEFRVGVNTNSPTAPLHVVGNVRIQTDSAAAGKYWVSKDADGNGEWRDIPSSGSTGSGLKVLTQSTAPTDTTAQWLDNSTGSNGVWPIKQRINGQWRIIRWYDPIANFVSDKRPLYVLGTGQSNMIYRTSGGDLSVDSRVIEYTGGSWGIANRVSGNANNIALQFAKQIARRENRVVRFSVIALASRPIEDWYPAATKTNEIATLVRQAGIDSFDVVLWRQGETNADNGDADTTYERKFNTVLAAYRDSSWYGKSCRTIVGGLNESYINFGVFNYFMRLNNGDKSGVGITAVNMLGLSRAGGIHIDGASIDTVGARYYEAYAGKSNQYALEKTPNVSWYTGNQLLLSPFTSNSPALRLGVSASQGINGGFMRMNSSTSNLELGWNPTINGTPTNDSVAMFINGFSQVGFGKANNTLTTNRSQVHIRSNQPIAFSIGSGVDNAKLQIDSTGSFTKPIFLYNQYSTAGNIVLQHQSGNFENGRIRFTRVSTPTAMTYRGMFIHFDGSANLLRFGSHGSNDTTAANDNVIFAIDESGRGVSIKKTATPTAYLEIGASLGTANTAPIRFNAGTNLVIPVPGAFEYDGTNFFGTDGTATRYTFAKTLTNTITLDFPSTAAQSSSDLTVTVTGAAVGDVVSVGVPNGSVLSNSCFTAWVSATNTVTIRFNNYSSGSQDPASGTYRASVIKY